MILVFYECALESTLEKWADTLIFLVEIHCIACPNFSHEFCNAGRSDLLEKQVIVVGH